MVNCDTLKFIIKKLYICSHGQIEIRNLEYTGHHKTKKATNRCCGSLFLFLEKLFQEEKETSTTTTAKEVDNSHWIK